jgi:predicted transcriptional regulator
MRTVRSLLKDFQFSRDEQTIYLSLLKYGWSSALQLSRRTDINRTTLYRLLEELQSKGYVEIIPEQSTTLYAASPFTSFTTAITELEQKAENMQSSLEQLQKYMTAVAKGSIQETEVHLYRGEHGLQTMEWRTIGEKIDTMIFGTDQWRTLFSKKFTERIRQARVNSSCRVFELLNPQGITALEATVQPWTNVLHYIESHFYHRQISPIILPIQTELIINPDACFMFSMQQDDLVGLEIRNRGLALMLRNLFKMAWDQAEIIDENGKMDVLME